MRIGRRREALCHRGDAEHRVLGRQRIWFGSVRARRDQLAVRNDAPGDRAPTLHGAQRHESLDIGASRGKRI